MPTDDEFIAAAWEAAPSYGLTPTSITILSRSENVVCAVNTPSKSVAMRFHRPGYNTAEELISELEWVRSLADSGLTVPEAIPTTSGSFYIESTVAAEAMQLGVVGWVSGDPVRNVVRPDDPAIIGHYRIIGELAANIRVNADSWTPPASFVRRRWDVEGLVGENPLWGRFWEADGLTDDETQICLAARDKLRQELAQISTGPDRFGLIHSDLHLGNVMLDGSELTVIDFDDAGYGWFAYELAVALHSVVGTKWVDECKAAMIEGYRSVCPLESSEADLIDTFLVVRSLVNIGWLDARQDLPSYSRFPYVAHEGVEDGRRYLQSTGDAEYRCDMDDDTSTVKTTAVHNQHDEYDIYIGREVPEAGLEASKWGNPFVMADESDAERDRAIAEYRGWIVQQSELMAALGELKGLRLGCWCAPKPCHGDVLAQLVEEN